MHRDEHEQEDSLSRGLPFEVAVVPQHPPQPVLVHNIVGEEAGEGAGIFMAGRVGVAPALASKISCEDVSCTKTPSYGYEIDRRRRRCGSHKLENMVYLKRRKCAEPDCTRLSSYGGGSEGARYCLLHKHPDMIDLVNRRCETLGCNRRPVFAMTGQKARSCSDHRKVNMTDVANHLCLAFRCALKACWGLPGRRATVCFIHRTDQMQKKGGGRSGTSSRSGRSISNASNTSDEAQVVVRDGAEAGGSLQPMIAPLKQEQPDDGVNLPYPSNSPPPAEAMGSVRSDSASDVVEEDPIPATHPSREWLLPFGMMGVKGEMTAAAGYAPTGRHGDLLPRPYLMIPPPGPHLHQPPAQSSMLPQRPSESTSMHNGAHRLYADQQFNLGNSRPGVATSLLPHSLLQHQHTPCYPHPFPASTLAEPYSFPNYGWVPSGPMLIDSRFQQQQYNHHQHAAFLLQMQHQHNMRQMHMPWTAGAMFRPDMSIAGRTSNGGGHSSSVNNSTIDKQLQMHADGISRHPQGATPPLPPMAEMLCRAASEGGSSGDSDGGKMHT